ncbi:MAG: cobalamin biosynthesis protein CobD [Ruminiclostridium sp.]|nr:cobalamin biosynthesis protein CobD [Ruminiclostridium sp.]
MRSLYALLIGFGIDLLLGDPHGLPHPVVAIGKLISALEKTFRSVFSKTETGERLAGGLLWLIVVTVSTALPAALLWGCMCISPWLRLAAESIMCWQILAVKSLRVETMKVYKALTAEGLEEAHRAVSMIVGRDTSRLDREGIIKAAVETAAENTSDGVIAPMLFMALGGAPLGFFYKAVNTMDSMLGYTDPPYTNIGLVPAKADDVANFIPARVSAILLLGAGAILDMNCKNGWRIFLRDRYKHASPNSAQTESMVAGLLSLRLSGDAWYHGVLHKKPYIGDPIRDPEAQDIPKTCRLMTVSAFLMLALITAIKLLLI